jgi:hypothetical protein
LAEDTLVTDRDRIQGRLNQVLADPTHGAAIRQDLIDGFSALPEWMQSLVRTARPQSADCSRQDTTTAQ